MTVRELLACLDGSSQSVEALAMTAALAPALDAAVSVVTVTEPESGTWEDRAWLDERCADAGVHPHRRLVVPAADTVGALVELAGPETVLCLTSHGHRALRHDALGSVAAGVVSRATVPVLVVGPHAAPPSHFDVVQLCLDGSDLAGHAVAPAAVWCRQLGATPWLMTVVPPDVASRAGETAGRATLEGTIRDLRAEGLKPQWDVLHDDDAARALAASAAKLGATMVVAGTHGATGMRQAVLGSVAGELVRHAPCAVLLAGPGYDA
jgi:nucleotide-binding universal stress UspA family protein